MQDRCQQVKTRKRVQWLLLPLVFLVIGLGWKYPLLGFVVPIVMFMGITGAFFNGRYVCGNLCPRGAFYDRVLCHLSPSKPIPSGLKNMWFRWMVCVLLMGFMGYRVLQHPAMWQHWGYVFWSLCMITTFVGLVLGILIHQRAWCAFCPIGTFGRAIGGKENRLHIDDAACIGCRKCEHVCPLTLSIIAERASGLVQDPDCLHCGECISVCPKAALTR